MPQVNMQVFRRITKRDASLQMVSEEKDHRATKQPFFKRRLRLRGNSKASVPLSVVVFFPALVILFLILLLIHHISSSGSLMMPAGAPPAIR